MFRQGLSEKDSNCTGNNLRNEQTALHEIEKLHVQETKQAADFREG